jgi:hypothetical protein
VRDTRAVLDVEGPHKVGDVGQRDAEVLRGRDEPQPGDVGLVVGPASVRAARGRLDQADVP